MREHSRRGFTILDLIVVTAAVTTYTAVNVPGLFDARKRANEASTITTMRNVVGAQTDYYNNSSPHTYATLERLYTGQGAGGVSLLSDLRRGHEGYTYTMTLSDPKGSRYRSFTALACPTLQGITGESSYYVTESGVIYQSSSCSAAGGTPALEYEVPADAFTRVAIFYDDLRDVGDPPEDFAEAVSYVDVAEVLMEVLPADPSGEQLLELADELSGVFYPDDGEEVGEDAELIDALDALLVELDAELGVVEELPDAEAVGALIAQALED
jgi:type II secretory pathway pseudopilin PulG